MTDRLDHELRDVPVPEGMLGRLRKNGFGDASDAELDAALNEVVPPREFADRLRNAVWEGVELDQQLCEVEVSDWFLVRLRNIANHDDNRLTPWVRSISAAAALLMLAAAYGLAMWEVADSLQQEASLQTVEYIYEGPLQFDAGSDRVAVAIEPPPALLIQEAPAESRPSRVVLDFVPEMPTWFVTTDNVSHSDLLSELVEGYRPDVDWMALRSGVFGSSDSTADELPRFAPAPLPPASGVEPPLARGYDRLFLLRHRAQPIVQLPGDSELATSAVPLSAATPHFDRLAETLAAGRPPARRDVRVDEFITAIGPPLAAANSRELALRIVGGPSPFHRGESRLLLLGAKAGTPLRTTPATHLTIAIDTSSSMAWESRLEATRRAVRRIVETLGQRDRLSIVTFNEQAETIVEFAGRADGVAIEQALQQIQTRGGTHLSRGIQQGISTAMHPDASALRKLLVLVTDDHSERDGLTAEMVEMISAVSEFDLHVELIHFGDDSDVLRNLESLGINVRRFGMPTQIGDALIESLVGNSALIGEACEMRIEWNSQKVAAWRLLGHEPAVGGMSVESRTLQLSARQASHVAYEVWLRPDADGEVAAVTLSWRDAGSGRLRSASQPVFASQFAPTFAESPRALQAASLAAESAETLRRSPYATSPRGDLRLILDRCEMVSDRLAGDVAFERFVGFLKAMQMAGEQIPYAKGSN